MQKSHQSGLPVRHLRDEQIHNRNRPCGSHRDPFPGKTCNKQNRCGHHEDINGSSEVGLQQDQYNVDQNRSSSWENRLPEIFLAEFHAGLVVALLIEKPCQVKDGGKFGQFRRLNADWAEFDPTMCGVGFVQKKRADEQEQDDADYGINDRGLAQTPIVCLHQSKHPEEAYEKPGRLAYEKNVRVAILLFRRDC